jgi:hypothetical protein
MMDDAAAHRDAAARLVDKMMEENELLIDKVNEQARRLERHQLETLEAEARLQEALQREALESADRKSGAGSGSGGFEGKVGDGEEGSSGGGEVSDDGGHSLDGDSHTSPTQPISSYPSPSQPISKSRAGLGGGVGGDDDGGSQAPRPVPTFPKPGFPDSGSLKREQPPETDEVSTGVSYTLPDVGPMGAPESRKQTRAGLGA